MPQEPAPAGEQRRGDHLSPNATLRNGEEGGRSRGLEAHLLAVILELRIFERAGHRKTENVRPSARISEGSTGPTVRFSGLRDEQAQQGMRQRATCTVSYTRVADEIRCGTVSYSGRNFLHTLQGATEGARRGHLGTGLPPQGPCGLPVTRNREVSIVVNALSGPHEFAEFDLRPAFPPSRCLPKTSATRRSTTTTSTSTGTRKQK